MMTKKIAVVSIFGALYAALVYSFAGISFQLVQVRVADALIPLSIVFGWPAVIGVTLGCAVSNIISPMPSIIADVTFGTVANFIASLVAWKIESWKRNTTSEILGCLAATVSLTFIVGTYLAVITGMTFTIWWVSVFIGSVISINVLGFILIKLLKRSGIKS